MSSENVTLEWSRWCPFPKVGDRVEFMVDNGSTMSGVQHGSVHVDGLLTDDGTLVPCRQVGTWRPESVTLHRAG